jgi:large subunit ribosomal protein L6
MSRLAKKPITIPSGVTATQKGESVLFKGPKGEKEVKILPGVSVKIEGQDLSVSLSYESRQSRKNLGTTWSLLRNAVTGVSVGFLKTLEIQGVGFRAALEGKTLVLSLGFVNPVRYQPVAGVTIELEKNFIKVSGVDKEFVGQAAAQIRSFKKPEPYKGKGIRYAGEVITLKAGKKAATGA